MREILYKVPYCDKTGGVIALVFLCVGITGVIGTKENF